MSCIKIKNDRNCNIIIEDSFEDGFIQVYILKYINQETNQIILRKKSSEEVKFKYKGDGQYTICKLSVPLDTSKPYYFKEDKFYNFFNEVSLKEILEVNPNISKINPEYIYYFSTCQLRKCFINICQEIFDSQTSICNKSNVDGFLTYKRDLLWSALNVIEYLIDMCQIEEAQRLLDEITDCNGLCPKSKELNKSTGCGCGS